MSTSAERRPAHISGAVDDFPAVCAAWIWNETQRNAPDAVSAMAFTVTPVSERLRFISPGTTFVSATRLPFSAQQD